MFLKMYHSFCFFKLVFRKTFNVSSLTKSKNSFHIGVIRGVMNKFVD